MSENLPISSTKQSKIIRYRLEADVVDLRKQGFSYQEIADELNSSGRVPEDDQLDKYVVMRFLQQMPEIQKQIVQESKSRLVEVVNTNMQIASEVASLYASAKTVLENMEQRALQSNSYVDPYRFKAVASEMREILKQMTEIQREISDAENVQKFMEIILTTLKEECPEVLPIVAEKLRALKGTQWYADMVGKGGR